MVKKVVILGCGNVGSDVARYVAEDMSDVEITVADYKLDVAQALAEEIGGKAVQFDATVKEDVEKVLEGADIVFNGVGPFHRFAMPIIEQAIASKVNYVDINDDFDVAQQLVTSTHYDEAAKEAGISIIFGAGSTPGLTNILSRWAVDELESTESIEIVWGVSFTPNLSTAVIDHMFHCLIGDVPQFIDGEMRQVPAWSGEKTIALKPPFNEKSFVFSGHAEPITLPHYLKEVKNVTVRSTFFQEYGNELYKQLINLGLVSNTKVEKFNISPRQFIAEFMNSEEAIELLTPDYGDEPGGAVFRVDVSGLLNALPTTITYEFQLILDESAKDPTSVCGAAIVCEVLNDNVKETGLFAPEAIIDPQQFIERVMKRLDATLFRQVVTNDVVATKEALTI